MITRPRRRCNGSGSGERICGYVPRPRLATIAPRTLAQLPIEEDLRRVSQPPLYRLIGPQVAQFHPLGFPTNRIAVAAGCHGQDGCQNAALASVCGTCLSGGAALPGEGESLSGSRYRMMMPPRRGRASGPSSCLGSTAPGPSSPPTAAHPAAA